MNGAKFVALLVVTSLYREAAEGASLVPVTACRGSGGLDCTALQMDCSPANRTFIHSAEYGYKQTNSNCSWEESNCEMSTQCCGNDVNACYGQYADNDWEELYKTCWNRTTCKRDVKKFTSIPSVCTKDHKERASIARVYYLCLEDSAIINFHSNDVIVSPAVAVQYNSFDVNDYVFSGDNQTWHCQVDTADCVQHQADVILVREKHGTGHFASSSSLGWSGGDFMPRKENFQFLRVTNITPFRVSVSVGKERQPNAWALVRGEGQVSLRVRCGYTDKDLSSASFCEGHPDDGSSTLNVGAVIGTVVIVLVVVTLVAVGGVCFLRRRGRLGENQASKHRADANRAALYTVPSSAGPDTSTIPPAHNVHAGVSKTGGSDSFPVPEVKGHSLDGADNAADADSTYDKIGDVLRLQDGHPSSSDLHGNPRSPVEDPDYDRLGGKKPQSSSSNPAATYGRLGEVGGAGEDTDYSNDHLARGRQAAPDVIDSDYSTSALKVMSEGDYNVAGIPPKQHVITGSDYDVAQIVTSEGDYNRVDFQAKKQHVITGSDYDTAEIVTSEGDYNKLDFQGEKQKVLSGSDYDMTTAVTSGSI